MPALPAAWGTGRVSGLRARGGLTVDIAWEDGSMTEATIATDQAGAIEIVSPEPVDVLKAGMPIDSGITDFGIRFGAEGISIYTIIPKKKMHS